MEICRTDAVAPTPSWAKATDSKEWKGGGDFLVAPCRKHPDETAINDRPVGREGRGHIVPGPIGTAPAILLEEPYFV